MTDAVDNNLSGGVQCLACVEPVGTEQAIEPGDGLLERAVTPGDGGKHLAWLDHVPESIGNSYVRQPVSYHVSPSGQLLPEGVNQDPVTLHIIPQLRLDVKRELLPPLSGEL